MPNKKTNKKSLDQRIENSNTIAPEDLVMDVINGKRKITTKSDQLRLDLAVKMLPYRLPKLAQVEAVNKNVEYSHAEFIKAFDNEDKEE